MTDRAGWSEERVAGRLRDDAERIGGAPSEAARARMRAALEDAAFEGPAAPESPPQRWITRHRLATTLAAAAALACVLLGARAMRPAAPKPTPPSPDAVLALRTAFDPLLDAPRLPERTAAPLHGELLAMAEDVAAVADEMLSRLPAPLSRACARRTP